MVISVNGSSVPQMQILKSKTVPQLLACSLVLCTCSRSNTLHYLPFAPAFRLCKWNAFGSLFTESLKEAQLLKYHDFLQLFQLCSYTTTAPQELDKKLDGDECPWLLYLQSLAATGMTILILDLGFSKYLPAVCLSRNINK